MLSYLDIIIPNHSKVSFYFIYLSLFVILGQRKLFKYKRRRTKKQRKQKILQEQKVIKVQIVYSQLSFHPCYVFDSNILTPLNITNSSHIFII